MRVPMVLVLLLGTASSTAISAGDVRYHPQKSKYVHFNDYVSKTLHNKLDQQKVNCDGRWSPWGRCSTSCGSKGLRFRTYTITQHGQNGGLACMHDNEELDEDKCNRKMCPVPTPSPTPKPTRTIREGDDDAGHVAQHPERYGRTTGESLGDDDDFKAQAIIHGRDPTTPAPTPALRTDDDDRENKEKAGEAEDMQYKAQQKAKRLDDDDQKSDDVANYKTTAPTAVPTAYPTINLLIETKINACKRLRKQVDTKCKSLFGKIFDCTKQCHQIIMDLAKTDQQTTDDLVYCPIIWQNYMREDFCWPDNCVPVIKWMCSDMMKKVIPGYFKFTGRPDREEDLIYYGGCDVCMDHYIWKHPPIRDFKCWLFQRKGDFCGPANAALGPEQGLPNGKPLQNFNALGDSVIGASEFKWKAA